MLIEAPSNLITNEEFNAGYENFKIIDIAHKIKSILEKMKIEVKIEIKPVIDERSYHISSKKIKERLNFVPKHSLDEGIKEVVEMFKLGIIKHWDEPQYHNIKTMKLLDLK